MSCSSIVSAFFADSLSIGVESGRTAPADGRNRNAREFLVAAEFPFAFSAELLTVGFGLLGPVPVH